MNDTNTVEICDMWQLSELSYKRGFDLGYDAARIVLTVMAEAEAKDGDYYSAGACLEAINDAERRAYELYGKEGLPTVKAIKAKQGPARSQ